jgi:integrase
MNPTTLLKLAEQHLALTRPTSRPHPDDEVRNRGRFRYRKNLLCSFVQFWAMREHPWPIPAALAIDWVGVGAKPGQPYRDRHRMLTIRGFLTHLRTIEPDTDVPRNIFRKPPRRDPRLLSQQEIAALMEATTKLRTCSMFRRATMATLLGLLASTGLRIGEALRLKLDEVHLEAETPFLTIRDTKFGKSRMVALHPTAALRLCEFGKHRAEALGQRSPQAFFANRSGNSLGYNSTRITFLRLLRHAGIVRRNGERPVTLHSFRHGFAVRRLTLWHQAGESVTELLPHLSVYMGHVDPKDTYWYLTATPELLEAASARFEDHHKEATAQ